MMQLHFGIRSLAKKIVEILSRFIPLQNKVILCNFHGRGFGDDPKYIAQKLLELKPDIKLYWLSSSKNNGVPENIHTINIDSIVAWFHLATAKIWIFNIKDLERPTKRKRQFYLQTWHGTMSLKKVEAAIQKNLPLEYIKKSMLDSTQIDLMYSNNDQHYTNYKQSYWYHGEVKRMDVPRDAMLINPPKDLKKNVLSFWKLPESTKIILYAPTFRATEGLDVYKWDYLRVINAVENRFGGNFVMLLRMHPNISKHSALFEYSNKVINASIYPDMQELLASTDILINDFSASMFEFGILVKKPVFLIAKDYDNYINNERSLEFDIKEIPFSLACNEEQLLSNIANYDNKKYLADINSFQNKWHFYDSGKGDTEIAKMILGKMT